MSGTERRGGGQEGEENGKKGKGNLAARSFQKVSAHDCRKPLKKDDNDMFKMNTNKVPSVTYSGRRQSRSKSSNRLKSTAEKLKEF